VESLNIGVIFWKDIKIPVIIQCDHKNPGLLKQAQSLTPRQIVGQQRLFQYHIKFGITRWVTTYAPDASIQDKPDHGKQEPINA